MGERGFRAYHLVKTPPISVVGESTCYLLSEGPAEGPRCLSHAFNGYIDDDTCSDSDSFHHESKKQFITSKMSLRRSSVNADPDAKDEALLAELGYR